MWLTQIFFCISLIFSSIIAQATESAYIIDPQHRLTLASTQKITHMLNEAATVRDIHIRVFIVDETDLQALMQHAKTRDPAIHNKAKMISIIINPVVKKNALILGDSVPPSETLYSGLSAIQDKMLSPLLAKGYIDRAAWEASVACVAAMEEWTVPTEITWFEEYILAHWKVIGWIASLWLVIWGAGWFFRPTYIES